MKLNKWGSISAKLFFPILLVNVIFSAFVYFVWLPSTTKVSIENAALQVEQTLASVAEGIVPLLLQNQLSNVYDTLDLVKQGKSNWIDLQVLNVHGKSLYPLVVKEIPKSSSFVRVLREEITVGSERIGEIILVYDMTAQIQRFRDQIEYLLTVFIAVFSLMLFVMILALKHVIISPVKALKEAAQELKNGNYNSPLPAGGHDEIGLLVACFRDSRNALLSTRNELIAARDDADAANAAKSIFLANMSHELRTPMTGVLGITELLLEDATSQSDRKLLHAIHQSGRRLLSILNDVLDISKIEAGGLELDVVQVDIARNVSDMVELFRPVAEKKGITLDFEDEEDIPLFNGDSIKICQIISNFISNAVKFTSSGGVSVKISIQREYEDGILHVQVVDSGVGISPNKQGRVFEKFSQADMTVTRKYGGTGLGLAICQELTNFLGGEIGVESILGKGSVFWIKIPISFKNLIEQKEPLRRSKNAMTEQEISETNILLVEDDPINLLFAQKVFEKIGVRKFTLAENGQKAIECAKDQKFDIVFMDCHMPVLDGYQATQSIRNIEAISQSMHTPILAVTANAMVGDREKCIRSGMNDVLTKPFSRDKLKAMITKWV
jgi:signal transduction histidine kinase/CheY-like chemotaxis protein